MFSAIRGTTAAASAAMANRGVPGSRNVTTVD